MLGSLCCKLVQDFFFVEESVASGESSVLTKDRDESQRSGSCCNPRDLKLFGYKSASVPFLKGGHSRNC